MLKNSIYSIWHI